ncbi:FtsW/RodA/SpoVE family cell cycle protein [Virgibacillus necropolis]|uniref:Cell division protein n=1 Tax=Virgibacillus necropolis TaxID=163877 RepID=A0A221MFU9_9BACI|nr:FtsW/RodA/SpoVE family cell cycle protein [Virgibacillus necropolis]ASN06505.1 cell division protein [Virgibacillus necropolis]
MEKENTGGLQFDLIIIFLLFMATSLTALYNLQELLPGDEADFLFKQFIWYSAGALFIFLIRMLDLNQLYQLSFYAYLFGVLILGVLLVSPESLVPEINGTYSWFAFPGIGTIQPAEFTKITTILGLAITISKHKEKYVNKDFKTDFILLLKLVIIAAIPVFLILLQPDFGTSMVYLVILSFMVLVSGINWKLIFTIVASAAIIGGGALMLIVNYPQLSEDLLNIDPYQIERIETWFGPEEEVDAGSYQVNKSFLAIGSGQLFGKGIGDLQVPVPYAETDFIFSVIAESFGFVGSSFVVFLYFFLIYKLVSIGLKIYNTSVFGSMFCFGYMALISVHTFQNIGMSIGIMPITGVPLLLISYGGSSVLATLIGYGIIYRVSEEITNSEGYMFGK